MYKNFKSEILVILSAFLWASSFAMVKYSLEYASVYWGLFLRFFFASALFIFIMIKLKINLKKIFYSKKIWFLGLLNSLSFFVQYYGITITTAIKVTIYVNTYILLVPAISIIFLKEKISNRLIKSILLGFTGVILLVTEGNFAEFFSYSGNFLSEIFILSAGFFWAIYIIGSKKILEYENVLGFTGGLTVTSGVFLLPMAIFMEGTSISMSLTGHLIILYLAIFPTFFAYFIYFLGLKGVSATASSLLLIFEVIFSIFLSMLILGEKINLIMATGIIMTIYAIYYSATTKTEIKIPPEN